MKRVKSKLAIAVIAVAAIGLIAGLGASAYWSVSQLLAGNTIESGHLIISAYNDGSPGVITPLAVSGLMPGDPLTTNKRVYVVESAAGNPLTDLAFSVPIVNATGTLADNVEVAFALTTSGTNGYWLTPTGPVSFPDGTNTDNIYATMAFPMADYEAVSWTGMPGYVDMTAGSIRHIVVYYYLPTDCSEDCHDSTVEFDMSFELLQSH